MLGKQVIVIGGSIAGCAAAIMLRRLGAKVTILERSSGRIGQGSGISLPKIIVDQCIELDLFDPNIARLNLNGRSFIRKEEQGESDSTTFWTQALRVIAFNWSDVYQSLRKRIEPDSYFTHTKVCAIEPLTDSCRVRTNRDETYEADLVIAADGVDSTTRSHLFPGVCPEYVGYIAWRGLIDEPGIVEQSMFNEHTPYFVFPNGHLLLYRVPGPDFHRTGQTILSWTLYENRQGLPLQDLLIDNQGIQRSRSLPAGTLAEHHIQYLHDFSQRVLPSSIAKIIAQTPQPFILAVFDCQTPAYLSNHIVFVGDAASTLRPHPGAGLFKALANGINLAKLIESNSEKTLSDCVAIWKEQQPQFLAEEILKAQRMGAALVTDTPSWMKMNQSLMDLWWEDVMQGKTWHATPEYLKHLA